MTNIAPAAEEMAEMVREDHLRIAVLLDTIEDELAESKPISEKIAELRMEYDAHAIREEQALAAFHPDLLEPHRLGHDRMRALLGQLSVVHDYGGDIAPLLAQVVGMFTGQLMPADTVFTARPRPSAAP
ncbi:MAG: hemerythrin domain-containing protein [Bacteroidales bacterium]